MSHQVLDHGFCLNDNIYNISDLELVYILKNFPEFEKCTVVELKYAHVCAMRYNGIIAQVKQLNDYLVRETLDVCSLKIKLKDVEKALLLSKVK